LIQHFDVMRRMVDVDSVLLSVQERDKWRHRMELLERSLRDVRDRRQRAETRLRRIRKELSRLRVTRDALLDLARSQSSGNRHHGAASFPIR
jgi:hypothetical protein